MMNVTSQHMPIFIVSNDFGDTELSNATHMGNTNSEIGQII